MTADFDARAEKSVDIVARSLPPTPAPVTVREVDILRFVEATGARLRRDAAGVLIAPPLFLPPFPPGDSIGHDGRRRPDVVGSGEGALPYRLMAGCEVEFGTPIRAGESITATCTLDSVVKKDGRTGPMLLTTTATTYRDHRGEVKRVERWTIIHRD